MTPFCRSGHKCSVLPGKIHIAGSSIVGADRLSIFSLQLKPVAKEFYLKEEK